MSSCFLMNGITFYNPTPSWAKGVTDVRHWYTEAERCVQVPFASKYLCVQGPLCPATTELGNVSLCPGPLCPGTPMSEYVGRTRSSVTIAAKRKLTVGFIWYFTIITNNIFPICTHTFSFLFRLWDRTWWFVRNRGQGCDFGQVCKTVEDTSRISVWALPL